MVQINNYFYISAKPILTNENSDTNTETAEISTISKNEIKDEPKMNSSLALDIIEGKTRVKEKFSDVRAEMDKKVPDRTTTIEEKKLAISYIDRMLNCDDISPDLKRYWTNKKTVIEMEIQNIKNSQKNVGTEKIGDVWKEFSEFTNKYFNSLNDSMSMEEKYENRVTYYNTYKTFIQRFLNCIDITNAQRVEYNRMLENADRDLVNWEQDYQRYKNSQ